MDANTENRFFGAAKRDVVAGLQFAFDLPYKGYVNVAPLMYWEFANHNSFAQCDSGLLRPVPGVTCLADGNTSYKPTWAVEVNYYMDLGFLPENMQFFSISGRAGWYGKKGSDTEPLPALGAVNGVCPTADRVQHRTDPSDLRRQQGVQGSEILALRRRLGRLSLLAEQVRPRSQCPVGACLHHRGVTRPERLLHRVARSTPASR